MSDWTICFIQLIDLVIVLNIPFESIFDFQKSRDGNTNSQNYTHFNYLYYLERNGILDYVSDVINAYLLTVIVITAIYFFRFNPKLSFKSRHDHNDQTMSLISFMMLITGRYLTFNILGI